ncbi:uncharacterized protein LOC133871574 [Alnus glutinosa]|uniref:uncharacterized protein LOC133871574 n=1 Tax=Alnus glutinosa TaxID=3517 RepID=UPI002D793234|nr:uncharacterized protein LOC133871574 [Alnus glutinosa]
MGARNYPRHVQEDIENQTTIGNSTKSSKKLRQCERMRIGVQNRTKVFLKITPMKGVLRFGRKGKLSPRFVGPFEILEKFGTVAYRLVLPPNLARVHNMFHISMLRKYVLDPTLILDSKPLQIRPNMTYEETPIKVLDRKEQVLRNKSIPVVKILWNNHSMEEASWELEEVM